MTTLITGATGFVGSAVARTLARRGHALRLLTRPSSDRRNLAGLDADIVTGDLTDPASLARAAAGCRYVVHVAADYRLWVPDPDAMMRANVEGAVAMIRAAADAGAERIVHCSSVAALGQIGDGTPANEATPTNEADFVGAYKRSKYRAERAVLELAARESMPVVVVNPAAPVGPRDIKPTPTGKMVLDAARGRAPAYIDTGLNVVHVEDVAEGHALALERGRIGERYVLGGDNMLLKDILGLIADVAGQRPPLIRIPEEVIWPVGSPENGSQEDVLFIGQGGGRAWLQSQTGPRGGGGRRRLVPRGRHAAPVTSLAFLSFLIWCWLLTMRGQFWRAGPVLPTVELSSGPAVAIVVPARDEAPLIGRTVRSLLAQKYPGPLHVTIVDDRSEDGTRTILEAIGNPRLTVLRGQLRPPGWAGKLWAVAQGISVSGAPEFYFLTDADIEHDPLHLASLVSKAEQHGLDMVSEMVALSCQSRAEKWLIPAFVFYFQLLYPFAWVNDPMRATAAAAGGTVLIRRRALQRIGGIEAVRGALIDDVALATAVKAGGRIFLGHSATARSIRPYPFTEDIWRMIARSAYAQLHFSPILLIATTLAMTLVWLVAPAAVLFGHGFARLLGLLTWVMFASSYLPTLARYRRARIWAAFLPATALFYMAATIASAVNHHLGLGVVWKGRAYAGGTP
jgi:hopene-associated glycosyltransferase HpnB/hopanoid-associated sugar epimerase